MITQNKHALLLAVNLAGLAGFIDALGFIKLGGFFVSFMSGNSTRFAVLFSQAGLAESLIPLGIIILFVFGVILGVVLQHFFPQKRIIAILSFVSFMLLLAATFNMFGKENWTIVCMVIAMGAENNVFVKDGEVNIGVTYMTGALVKFGQKLAYSLLGKSNKDWFPFFILWLGLITGAILGSLSYSVIGLNSLWIAAFFSVAILTAVHFFLNSLKQ